MPQVSAIFAGKVMTDAASVVSEQVQKVPGDWLAVTVSVTDVSGTDATAVFSIQWSTDGGTWADADPGDDFPPITAPCAIAKQFSVKAPYFRAVVKVTGTTPSFTGSANAYF